MTEDQEERLVTAFEEIGSALWALQGEIKQAGVRFWPRQREQREAVLSRVETPRERELKEQGKILRTPQEALAHEEEVEDEAVGPRTAQWLKDHPKNAPTPTGEELT